MNWISGTYECRLCMGLTWRELNYCVWSVLSVSRLPLSVMVQLPCMCITWIIFVPGFLHRYMTKGPLLLSQGVVFVSLSCLITIARPHKATHRNIIDSLVLALLGLLFFLLVSVLYIPHNKENHHLISAMVPVCIPHAVLLSYISYKLVEKIGIVQLLINKYRNLKQLELFIRHAPHNPETDVERELFPDRLHNPENYGPDA